MFKEHLHFPFLPSIIEYLIFHKNVTGDRIGPVFSTHGLTD